MELPRNRLPTNPFRPPSSSTRPNDALPSLSDLGYGADEGDFDPDWWPSVLAQRANAPRPPRTWAWQASLRHFGQAAGAAFVGLVVLTLIVGFALAERRQPVATRPPAGGSVAGLSAGYAASPTTLLPASPESSPAASPIARPTMIPLRVISPGAPPPVTAVRLDEPVLYWLPEIQAASAETGIPPELIAGIIRVESQGIPGARSPAGARGLMQVMPNHLRDYGIDESEWHDPATNINAGARLLKAKIGASGSELDGVRHYFGIGCDGFNCTNEYVTAVFKWRDHYAPLIAAPYSAGYQVLPDDE